MRTAVSSSAALRIDFARRFILESPPAAEILIVGASRAAADDLARSVARARRATFGLYRFSLTQLAARLAAPILAGERLAPATALGVQAVAARALFEVGSSLSYFEPVARAPGFPRALTRTLEELALAMVPAPAVSRLGGGGPDLAALYERFDEQFDAASSVDRARFLAAATRAALARHDQYAACRVLLLDVPIVNASERALVEALAARAPDACATVPAGDVLTADALAHLAEPETIEPYADGLDRMRQHLFASKAPPEASPLAEVELFSAPGEGRECVEMARRVVREARRGVPFNRMAIALRAPQHYAGLLEHALDRAGVPAYFERGTRRPHPAGRAFLALVRCAVDNLSARRFSEYLSLGQVPDTTAGVAADHIPTSTDEVFGAAGDRAEELAQEQSDDEAGEQREEDGADRQAFRAPWKWERLLAESRVVATEERWGRRLNGLVAECALQRTELARTEPESPRLEQLSRKIDDIRRLSAFALPLMRTLDEWPAQATWAEWLALFDALAPRVLKRPDRVLRVLADLRPMGAVGPITLAEAAEVLADRLATIEAEPPARRHGRVLVTTPAGLRGRSFDVVFIPGLAERLFPQKLREDPLLLDDARARLADEGGQALGHGLLTQPARDELEKLQLRLAVGAAESRLYVSFPTVEVGDGRPRVPSLYALEVWRAMTGRVPSADDLQKAAARASRATLAWPAPADPAEAIDALEHDLSTLRGLVTEPDDRARGRAHYMLQLNECLQRSVRERYMRGRKSWSHWDGITTATAPLQTALATYRLGARTFSLSALQKYSICPYQFLLGAIYRLRPADDLDPLHRMDPLTRGSLFHAIQAAFYRQLKRENALPVTPAGRERALAVLDEAVREIAREHYEQLAPAIDRVWTDEIAALRRDLRMWVDEIAEAGGEWTPKWFEWSFGLSDAGRDEASRREHVVIDGRYRLHGSIDLVEERANGDLRVTDHKTGRYRGKDSLIVGGGAVLQPVLYSLALEAATTRPVAEGRLYYATSDGGYREVRIPLTAPARRMGVEVLEIIDRAIEGGFLAAAPAERACTWCDFRPVCGPTAEHRIGRYKSQEPLADLLELRRKP